MLLRLLVNMNGWVLVFVRTIRRAYICLQDVWEAKSIMQRIGHPLGLYTPKPDMLPCHVCLVV